MDASYKTGWRLGTSLAIYGACHLSRFRNDEALPERARAERCTTQVLKQRYHMKGKKIHFVT